MLLTLEIDLSAVSGDPADEAGRILRYWGGAMKQLELQPGLTHTLMDSQYQPVGTLTITG